MTANFWSDPVGDSSPCPLSSGVAGAEVVSKVKAVIGKCGDGWLSVADARSSVPDALGGPFAHTELGGTVAHWAGVVIVLGDSSLVQSMTSDNLRNRSDVVDDGNSTSSFHV